LLNTQGIRNKTNTECKKIHRVCETNNAVISVLEGSSQISFAKRKLAPLVIAITCACSLSAHANPIGGTVTNGQATFNTTGNNLTVTNTPGTIINWQGFSINANEVTKFAQQSATSTVLNRVTSASPSSILGSLQSNGRVFLVNPNGIVFGAGSTINVGGLVATTLNLSDSDFLNGKHHYTANTGAQNITNAGNLTALDGGQIYLIAPNVDNSGVITAPNGQILLAAGSSVDIVNSNNPSLSVNVTAPAGNATNVGQLVASAGRLGLFGVLVSNSGTISADSATLQGGEVVLSASKTATIAGTVSAKSPNNNGSIVIEAPGSLVAIADGQLSANNIAVNSFGFIGKGNLDASGTNGGNISISSDYLSYHGALHADGNNGAGGNILLHTNGQLMMNQDAVITANGSNGAGGHIELINASGISLLSALIQANGSTGGSIDVTSPALTMIGARFHADGSYGGGVIRVGGAWQGGAGLVAANQLYVDETSQFSADALDSGNGGSINFWSQTSTQFGASPTALGGINGGNGGAIEVSSHDQLTMWGTPNAAAQNASGLAGNILLDPKNIIIDSAAPSTTLGAVQDLLGGTAPASFNAGSNFGWSVALNSSTALIGAYNQSNSRGAGAGNAYLFNLSTHAWTDMAADSNAPASWNAGSQFGTSVALNSSTALIGAYYNSNSHGSLAGNAYLYDLTTHAWTDLALDPNAPASWNGSDWFGYAVALNSTTALIGAMLQTNSHGASAGNAYFYDLTTHAWTDLAAAAGTPVSWNPNSQFGGAVALNSTTALISAYQQTNSHGTSAGTAYLYDLTTHTWTDLAADPNVPATLNAASWFGYSVALNSTTALIGAESQTNSRGSAAGNAYLYDLTTHLWTDLSTTAGVPSTWNASSSIGYSVALNNTSALIGAGNQTNSRGSQAGNAYLYDLTTHAWTDLTLVANSPSNWNAGTLFGSSVALNSTTALIGAYGQTNSRGASAGNAYLYDLTSHTWIDLATNPNAPASWITSSNFGSSVALNSSMALIGANGQTNSRGTTAGNAYLYDLTTHAWSDLAADPNAPTSWNASSQFGRSVALNSTTALIGAGMQTNSHGTNAGNAYLYDLTTHAWTDLAADPNAPASWNANSTNWMGWSVALNSTTALIGASLQTNSHGTNAGNAYIYDLTTHAWTDLAAATGAPLSWNAGSNFGTSVALNSTTALIGAYGQTNSHGSSAGNAYLYDLTTHAWTDLAADPNVPVTLNGGSWFGSSVALNSTTALIGADNQTNSRGSTAGNAYLYDLTTHVWTDLSTTTGIPASWNAGSFAGNSFGYSVALNSTTALIGSPANTNSRGANAGNAYLYNLSTHAWTDLAADPNAPASWNASSNFGVSVALNSNTALIGADIQTNSLGAGAGNAYLYSMTTPPATGLTYSYYPSADISISPASIVAILNTGSSLTLQASNDITVLSAILASNIGNGGALTLQAGRSILVNANINTGGGALTMIANDSGANASFRDVGLANIDTSLGTLTAGAINMINSGGNIIAGSMSTSGAINLAAAGTIKETTGALLSTIGQLTTSSVGGTTLNGANTIGSFNATNTTSGDINLTNTGAPFTINALSNTGGNTVFDNTGGIVVAGALSTLGTFDMTAHSPITINSGASISAGGNVSLIAGAAGSASPGDIITINGTVTSGGRITLAAHQVVGNIPVGAIIQSYTSPVSTPTPPPVSFPSVMPTVLNTLASIVTALIQPSANYITEQSPITDGTTQNQEKIEESGKVASNKIPMIATVAPQTKPLPVCK
jgi:filamentous hemagglutinin family protein